MLPLGIAMPDVCILCSIEIMHVFLDEEDPLHRPDSLQCINALIGVKPSRYGMYKLTEYVIMV